MSLKSHPRLAAYAAAVGAAIGVCVVIHRIGMGTLTFPGHRLLALSIGVGISGFGVFLFHRAARRRARLAAIRALLPRFSQRQRSWAAAAAQGRGGADSFWFDDSESGDDFSERIPVARADIRAATRALLVSLEDEMHAETTGGKRRQGRPACRRARLRAAGRPEARRRRGSSRPSALPS